MGMTGGLCIPKTTFVYNNVKFLKIYYKQIFLKQSF